MTRYLNLVTGDLYKVGDKKWNDEDADDIVKLLLPFDADEIYAKWEDGYWRIGRGKSYESALYEDAVAQYNQKMWYGITEYKTQYPSYRTKLSAEHLVKRKEFMDVEAVFKKLTAEPPKPFDSTDPYLNMINKWRQGYPMKYKALATLPTSNPPTP